MSDACLHRADESPWLREVNGELSDSEDEDARRPAAERDSDDGGASRFRCNTAVRLEKLKGQQKGPEIKVVKWTQTVKPGDYQFTPKDIVQHKPVSKLTCLIEAVGEDSEPFHEFKKFDGKIQQGAPSKAMKIFVPGTRRFPVIVSVTSNATVSDLIGLTCYLWLKENPKMTPIPNPDNLELILADDDGSPEFDFPPWDKAELVTRFSFNTLALAEKRNRK